MKFKFYLDKKKEYRWTIVGPNGLTVADCSEGYKKLSSCKKSLNNIIQRISLGKFKIVEIK